MKIIFSLLMLLTITAASYAQDERARLKEYLNDATQDVYKTDNPAEKREVLNNMFDRLSRAFDVLDDYPLISSADKESAKDFRNRIKEKQDELNGVNGFERVSDKDLNSFAGYSVQYFEQSAEYVTISVVALIVIALLLILLL